MSGVRPDSDIPEQRTLLLFSLREESGPFLKTRYAQERKKSAPVFWASVGSANAERQILWIFKHCKWPVRCLIVCGFAGGLAETMSPGSLIVADRVLYDANEVFGADSTLLATAESVRLPDIQIQRGTLVTGDRVFVKSEEKRELAARTGAIAVDMETAGAVRVAEARGVPWIAVRAITDSVNDDLPLDFNALANPDGSVNHGRVIRATLAQPWKIPALIRLGKRSHLAANNLAAFLVAFLQNLPDK